jgi:hypothetical protein
MDTPPIHRTHRSTDRLAQAQSDDLAETIGQSCLMNNLNKALRRSGREKQDCVDCTRVQSFCRVGAKFGHRFGGVQHLALHLEAGTTQIARQIPGDGAARRVEQTAGGWIEPGYHQTRQTFHVALSAFNLPEAFVTRCASRGVTDCQHGQIPPARTRCGSPYAICACAKQRLYAFKIERWAFQHPDFQHRLDQA